MNTQRALRLHGPGDLRLDDVPIAADPQLGEAQIRVTAVGICGSDLHTYLDGRIGDRPIGGPSILGHEFAGVVTAVGPDARDGDGQLLQPGTRVAVDPARHCGVCELCSLGHPNLCTNLDFTGLYPVPGALQDSLTVPARTCFPVPSTIADTEAAMLEPLGIGIHAIDLAHIRTGSTVAIIGSGSIGLSCLQVAQLAGPAQVFVTDRHQWRLDVAEEFGAIAINIDEGDPVATVMEATGGRGVDVALECAWSDDHAIAQAVNMLRNGGRLVVVGISGGDRLTFSHSAVRRKGLTIAISRRMKHTYPRAIDLVTSERVDVARLVTDHVPLEDGALAFADAASYRTGIIKAVVHPAAN